MREITLNIHYRCISTQVGLMCRLTFRKAHDFIMDISSYSSLLHLLVTSGDAAVADVVLDGVVEKHRILGDHADMGSQGCLLHLRKDDEDIAITSPGVCLVNTHSCIQLRHLGLGCFKCIHVTVHLHTHCVFAVVPLLCFYL